MSDAVSARFPGEMTLYVVPLHTIVPWLPFTGSAEAGAATSRIQSTTTTASPRLSVIATPCPVTSKRYVGSPRRSISETDVRSRLSRAFSQSATSSPDGIRRCTGSAATLPASTTALTVAKECETHFHLGTQLGPPSDRRAQPRTGYG